MTSPTRRSSIGRGSRTGRLSARAYQRPIRRQPPGWLDRSWRDARHCARSRPADRRVRLAARRPGGPNPVAKVTMPQLGESVAEGTIGKWLKQPGDHVAKYEPLLEVITDKVNAEVPSPFEGILTADPRRGGRDGPEQRRDRDHRDGRRGRRRRPPQRSAAAPPPQAHRLRSRERTPRPARPPRLARPLPRPSSASPGAPSPQPSARAGSDERPERAAATAPPSQPRPPRSPTGALPGDPDARMTPAVRRLLREHGLTAAMIVGHRRRRPDHPRRRARTTSRPSGRRARSAARSSAAPAPRRRRRQPPRRPGPARARRLDHAGAGPAPAPAAATAASAARSASRRAPTRSSCR